MTWKLLKHSAQAALPGSRIEECILGSLLMRLALWLLDAGLYGVVAVDVPYDDFNHEVLLCR